LRSTALTPADLKSRLESSGHSVESIAEVRPSLEDVFLDVVEKAGGAAA
jgi:hypothetical protein